MTVTLRDVVAIADLDLTVATSSPDLDRAVRWVAVSEQADPTPWIEPGDLVLTTGMVMDGRDRSCAAYVERLVQAEAVGLGFGIGLHHAQVPSGLVRAGERCGLPIIEVPEPVPFVAVSRAVSRLLTAEEYAESAASFESQRRMLRGVLASGETEGPAGDEEWAAAVLPVVARHVGGFALHLGSSGDLLRAFPAEAAERVAEVAAEVDRLRPRGLLASSSVVSASEHIVILPVGTREVVRGFLVVGTPRSLTTADQAVLNLAVSLLSWRASMATIADRDLDRWRALLLDVARMQGLTADRLARLGWPGMDPSRGVAVRVRPAGHAPVAVPSLETGILCREPTGGVVGLVAVDETGRVPAGLRTLASSDTVRCVGVSRVVDLTEAANVRTALEQADEAAGSGVGWCEHAELGSRSLDSLVDTAAVDRWAQAYLAPLMGTPEGLELAATLREWLAQHGQVDATAQELGIHRHTVRHRLRRAEVQLNRPLDDPGVRADLWFALRVLPDA